MDHGQLQELNPSRRTQGHSDPRRAPSKISGGKQYRLVSLEPVTHLGLDHLPGGNVIVQPQRDFALTILIENTRNLAIPIEPIAPDVEAMRIENPDESGFVIRNYSDKKLAPNAGVGRDHI